MNRKELKKMADLQDKYGGYWGDGHPVHDLATWETEVSNGDTRLGYWDWLAKILEE